MLDASKKAEVWSVLEESYGSEQRHYHTLNHVVEALSFVGLCMKAGRQLEDPLAVEWALWFHDAVYDPRAPADQNEEQSAELAERVLGAAGLPPDTMLRARRLILATASHLHGPEHDAHVVVDADLSILGAPLGRYIDYAIAVRREYAHLTDSEYSAARSKFLRVFLEREQLYATDVGKSMLEQQARTNLAHELQLTSVGMLMATSEDELPIVEEGCEEGWEEEGAAA